MTRRSRIFMPKKQSAERRAHGQPNFPLTPWEKWLSNASYTSAIRSYIESQSNIFRDLVLRHPYKNIIELGCGDGTLLMPTIISLHYNYLGVDVSTRALRKARINLKEAKLINSYVGDARLMVGDICKLSSLQLNNFVEPDKTLVVLPFNLIGIIPCVENLLQSLRTSGFDVLIFSYNRSLQASQARAEYYLKCGFTNIQRVKVNGVGILFTDQKELCSYAYYSSTLMNLFRKTGFKRSKIIPFDNIGIAYYCVN